MDELNQLTERIIGCAIEVHRALGPGLKEQTYESALVIEFNLAQLPFERQVLIPVHYKGVWVGDYRSDIIVDHRVVIEVKSVERSDPLFEAQMIAYLRASGKHVGLLIHFNSHLVTKGIRRIILSQ